jgi:hypothetical protein
MAHFSCCADSRVTQLRWVDIAGSHEVARLLPSSPATHSCEYDHQHARHTNNRPSQVSSSIRISTPARRKRGHRDTKGLHRRRTHILRDWIPTVYEKPWLDQGQCAYTLAPGSVCAELSRRQGPLRKIRDWYRHWTVLRNRQKPISSGWITLGLRDLVSR